VNIYAFGPIAAVLDTASSLVISLSDALTPLAGATSAALAIVLITLALRAVLIPVGVSQVRAQRVRDRLAPRIAALRQRHSKDAARMQRELSALYASEKASPMAGCMPLLVQAPILSGVYALFVLPTIAGHANALLSHGLFGAPLGTSLIAALGSGSPLAILVPAVVVMLVLAIAMVNRHRAVRVAVGATGLTRALSWLPLLSVLFAAIAPLAAALYLLVSMGWSAVERPLLLHLIPA
jgi:YidC/Oxa1 family membrane protein insertase